MNDVYSFKNSIINSKEMITYFKDRDHNSKEIHRNFKTLNSRLESIDTVNNIAPTATAVTFSVTGVGLVVLPISLGVASALSFGNKVLYKIIIIHVIRLKNKMKWSTNYWTFRSII